MVPPCLISIETYQKLLSTGINKDEVQDVKPLTSEELTTEHDGAATEAIESIMEILISKEILLDPLTNLYEAVFSYFNFSIKNGILKPALLKIPNLYLTESRWGWLKKLLIFLHSTGVFHLIRRKRFLRKCKKFKNLDHLRM